MSDGEDMRSRVVADAIFATVTSALDRSTVPSMEDIMAIIADKFGDAPAALVAVGITIGKRLQADAMPADIRRERVRRKHRKQLWRWRDEVYRAIEAHAPASRGVIISYVRANAGTAPDVGARVDGALRFMRSDGSIRYDRTMSGWVLT